MTISQLSTPDGVRPVHSGATATLDALRRMRSRDLDTLYRSARWGDKTAPLHGHPRGWVLAVPGLDLGLPAMLAAAAVRGPLNPWQGKSFRAAKADGGTGTNRVGFGRCTGAFRFRTYETVSVVDGLKSLAIDYDVGGNPGFARTVYDELRPVGAGLWLGRGMRRRPDKDPQLLLWFALDSNQQDAPVVW